MSVLRLHRTELANDHPERLSLRKLAERLDAAPMALYRHVANKEDLVDGMVDVVYGEVETPTGAGWKAAMRQRATSMRATLLAHPWAVGVMESRSPGPANLRYHNVGIACLREDAGLPIRTAIDAYNLMDSYLYGFALQEKTLPSPPRPRRDARPSRQRTRRWPRPTPTSSRWSKSSGPRATTTPSSSNGASSTSSPRSNSSAHEELRVA
jgi:AcrR family transcriptional regulator